MANYHEALEAVDCHIHSVDWMSWHCTHPDLRLWIPRYFGGQGRRLFVDLVHPEGRKMLATLHGRKTPHRVQRHATTAPSLPPQVLDDRRMDERVHRSVTHINAHPVVV
eukprot:scaffold28080_cov161-Skeletonema_marinoi.AAC.1